ncbi:MAG: HAD hydrolase-like protein [Oligoflexales bacterium]
MFGSNKLYQLFTQRAGTSKLLQKQQVCNFDFDGTIADTYQIAVEELNQLGKKYKLSSVQPSLGRNYPLRDALKRAGVKWYQTYAIARDLKKAMELKLDLIKPYSGLVRQLSQLKENGYRLGIMTSNSTFLVESFLEKYQIDVFDFIYSGSSLFAKNRLIRRIRSAWHPTNSLYWRRGSGYRSHEEGPSRSHHGFMGMEFARVTCKS